MATNTLKCMCLHNATPPVILFWGNGERLPFQYPHVNKDPLSKNIANIGHDGGTNYERLQ